MGGKWWGWRAWRGEWTPGGGSRWWGIPPPLAMKFNACSASYTHILELKSPVYKRRNSLLSAGKVLCFVHVFMINYVLRVLEQGFYSRYLSVCES